MLVVLGLLSMIPASVATGLRIVPPTDELPALLASFIPYGLLFWLPSALFLTIAAVRARRSRTFSRVSLLLLALVTTAGLLVSVHPCNPYCGPGLWPAEHTELRNWMDRQDDLATVVAGDFNAVDDHGPMRALYADGWRSAAHLAGAGFIRTYPANRRFPPLIGIDHVLLNNKLTAISFETFDVPGTDHLGVRAVITGTS